MKLMKTIKKKMSRLYRSLSAKLWLWGYKRFYRGLYDLSLQVYHHCNDLRARLISKRSELAQLKNKQRHYERLRVMVKASLSHGEHVKYVDKHTVKIKLDRKFHDSILDCIERIEDGTIRD